MTKVFIDGSAGTTGLRIYDRLAGREDVTLIRLDESERKDPSARREALNEADAAFLCLPDAAAVEAVSFLENPETVVIDTSTAHRTAEGWTYGFPELSCGAQREKIRTSKRIANPGCHASGFIALIAPLTAAGILSREAELSCFSLTGYSGGGKSMIAQYEADARDSLLGAPRAYGLSQSHKHLPEMKAYAGLDAAPVFLPVVAPYYAGMEVTVPLFPSQLAGGTEEIRRIYREQYSPARGGLIRYAEGEDPVLAAESGFLSAGAFAGRDDMEISVHGNDERILVTARFDNLGKGASGAAIQNLNIVMGLPEAMGLEVGR